MSDPEDVLIAAAERVGSATRALWGRRGDPRAAPARRAEAAQRRIATWLEAAFGVALPCTPCEAPPAAGRWERALGEPAPWRLQPQAVAWTDGTHIHLPRARLEGGDADDAAQLLLAALAQGLRAARGRAPAPPGPPVARDVRFALEAALGDAELAALLPGLAPALDAARAAARAQRPDLARLHPAEREVEALVRELLDGPAREARARVATVLGRTPEPEAVAAHADALAARWAGARYRGMAPVEPWGAPAAAPPPARERAASAGPERPRARPPRRATLPRPVRRRALDENEGDGQSGPFALPHGDPHLAVQDARGVVRPEDRGDEDADALAEELARAGELPVVRSPGEPGEVLASERAAGAHAVRRPASASASTELAFRYPEWDAALGAYRDPGIVLRERALEATDRGFAARVRSEHGPLLAEIRRRFEALRPRRAWVGRQIEGDAVDVDGIAAEHAERRAGLTPEGRVYARERPQRRDVAVALLLDASGSTDAWVSRGERVIDVAKTAALCLGEALAALGDRFALYAFSGRGPSDVRVLVAKRFAEPWGEAARARIGAVEPDRATRLGGAIRHATARLAQVPARVRLLLVLSDGKPDDDDAYEGRYGLEDVRQAVFEARRAGVRPFCVTIDRSGPRYLPRLFGPAGYTVLWEVRQLPARLPALYRRLAVV